MTSNREYTIFITASFKNEMRDIIYYLKYKLKEPLIADKFYNKVIEEISLLNYMPALHPKVQIKYEKRKLRKLLISNYVVVYEVNSNTRSSFYFTYIS